jgi:cohesin complex subunit SCC1
LPLTPPPLDHQQLHAEAPPAEKSKRKLKDRKQIIDSVTELQNGTATNANRGRAAGNANPLNTNLASITSEQHFLPRSSIVMRLLEIRGDPVTYFLPTQSKTNSTFYSAAPPGLTPGLAQLFIRPIPGATSHKRKGTSPGRSPSKRLRRDGVEVARRDASLAPSEMVINGENDLPGVDGVFEFPDQSGAMEDYQLELPDVGMQLEDERARSVFTDRSRLSSLGPEGLDDVDHVIDLNCPLSIFDVNQPTQTQQSQALEGDQDQADVPETNKQGYSKNTIKALGLVRKELQPSTDEDADEPKAMSFKQMSANVSDDAHSAFSVSHFTIGISTSRCIILL